MHESDGIFLKISFFELDLLQVVEFRNKNSQRVRAGIKDFTMRHIWNQVFYIVSEFECTSSANCQVFTFFFLK